MSHGPSKHQSVSHPNSATSQLFIRLNPNRKKMISEHVLLEVEEGYVCKKGSLIASFLHFFKPSAEE
jgi:hypothetical protein